jgi:ribonuclease HIII
MTFPTTKEDYYDRMKEVLEKNRFTVNPYRHINYGIQFIVFQGDVSGIVRIYDGKKGLRADTSQVLEVNLKQRIDNLLKPIELENGKLLRFTTDTIPDAKPEALLEQSTPKSDPEELIGVDESGKGDYFGPLVVVAVYTNPSISESLRALGVKDCKVLSDDKVRDLSKKIKELTAHSVIAMANKSYNSVYAQAQNLNHILSWAHAKAIETILEQTPCNFALSDQFGNPQMIRAQLYAKGCPITLYSRPRAEENIAVAAASIIARATFLEYLDGISQNMKVPIPKGSTDIAIKTAQKLVDMYGKDILPLVAKLHFKLTDQIKFPEEAPSPS